MRVSARGHANSKHLVMLLVCLGVVSGCVRSSSSRSSFDWVALERAAQERLAGRTLDRRHPTQRVDTGEEYEVHHELAVDGSRCYDIALAWAFEKRVHVRIVFAPDEQPSVNDRLRHVDRPAIGPRVGGVSFCTDQSGRVRLDIRPVAESMMDRLGTRPRYALAIGSHVETPEMQQSRHSEEEGERDSQLEQSGAERDARQREHSRDRCRECRRAAANCMAGNGMSCDRDYELCIGRGNLTEERCPMP